MVRDQVRDKLPYPFEDMGEQSVKNITRPVRVYAWSPKTVADLPVPHAASVSLPVAPRLSIVVLPFTNLSKDPDQQYFADGITEDVTTDLSRLSHSLVISRNAAFTYRNKSVDTKQIGRDVGVHYVLEGSVRRSGNKVRVSAQRDRRGERCAFVGRAIRRRHERSVCSAHRRWAVTATTILRLPRLRPWSICQRHGRWMDRSRLAAGTAVRAWFSTRAIHLR